MQPTFFPFIFFLPLLETVRQSSSCFPSGTSINIAPSGYLDVCAPNATLSGTCWRGKLWIDVSDRRPVSRSSLTLCSLSCRLLSARAASIATEISSARAGVL
eukprot:6582729-Prymnesium_polylepis.2